MLMLQVFRAQPSPVCQSVGSVSLVYHFRDRA